MLALILSHTATAAFLFSFPLTVLCDNQIYPGGNDSGGLATKCDLTLNFTTVSVATTCGTYFMPDGDPLYCLSIKSLDPSNSVEVYSDSACTLDAVVFNSIGDYDTHGTKACLVVQCTKTASQPATSFVNITGTTDYTPTEFDPDPDPDPEWDFVDNLPQPQTLLALSHICALSSNSTSLTHTTSASSTTSTTSTPLSSTKTTSSVESITKSASSSISTSAQGKPSPEPVPDDGPGDAGGLGLDGIGLPIGGALAGANAADIAASAAANAAISVETIIHLTDSDFSHTSSLLFSASNQTDYDIRPNQSVSLPTVLLPGVNGTNDTLF